MKRAVFGLVLVLIAAGAHVGLIVAGVWRKHPFEWWALAVAGALVALTAARRSVGAALVAAAAVSLAAGFVLATTVFSRIDRPELTLAPGQQLAPFGLVADDGTKVAFPPGPGSSRAMLLVLFRGVW